MLRYLRWILGTLGLLGAVTNSHHVGLAAPLSIVHDLGITTLPQMPRRIVALELSFVETLALLDITPVGLADDRRPGRLQPKVERRLGSWTSVGLRKQPSLEIIAALKPDLIIADSQRHHTAYRLLSKIAPTIALPSLGADYATIMRTVTRIGQAVGREDQARKAMATYQSQLEDLRRDLQKAGLGQGQVLFGVATSDTFTAHSPAAFTPGALTAMGLAYKLTDHDLPPLVPMSLPQLLALDPDYLIVGRRRVHTKVDDWRASPHWARLRAVRNGHVYEVDQTLWSRSRGILSSITVGQDLLRVVKREGTL